MLYGNSTGGDWPLASSSGRSCRSTAAKSLVANPAPAWAKSWGAAAIEMVAEIWRKAHADHVQAAAERRAATESQAVVHAQRASKQTKRRETSEQTDSVFAVHRRLTALGRSRKMVDTARAVMAFHDSIRASGFRTAVLKSFDMEGNPVFGRTRRYCSTSHRLRCVRAVQRNDALARDAFAKSRGIQVDLNAAFRRQLQSRVAAHYSRALTGIVAGQCAGLKVYTMTLTLDRKWHGRPLADQFKELKRAGKALSDRLRRAGIHWEYVKAVGTHRATLCPHLHLIVTLHPGTYRTFRRHVRECFPGRRGAHMKQVYDAAGAACYLLHELQDLDRSVVRTVCREARSRTMSFSAGWPDAAERNAPAFRAHVALKTNQENANNLPRVRRWVLAPTSPLVEGKSCFELISNQSECPRCGVLASGVGSPSG
ncbi:Uncharacterised protein [Achromobacter ruhlandii]|nr:Uncharacterised protein [Achromobacter ruhlandii]CUI41354.1 Uncharacterised protein [Achromobacter ruhlandii]CUJ93913.1 Uncharacterised protein [Achromobacter ruhlandii]